MDGKWKIKLYSERGEKRALIFRPTDGESIIGLLSPERPDSHSMARNDESKRGSTTESTNGLEEAPRAKILFSLLSSTFSFAIFVEHRNRLSTDKPPLCLPRLLPFRYMNNHLAHYLHIFHNITLATKNDHFHDNRRNTNDIR